MEATAKTLGYESMENLLRILSWEEPALFYQNEFREKAKTFPDSEYERLILVSTEEKFLRPMIDWQRKVIKNVCA